MTPSYNFGRVIIGKKVTISYRAYICVGRHGYTYLSPPLLRLEIYIGS